jgi:hypothetical protein
MRYNKQKGVNMPKKINETTQSTTDSPKLDVIIVCTKEIIHPRTHKAIPSDESGKTMLTLGDVVGTILSEEKSESIKPMKAWLLAQKFYTLETVEFDMSDFKNIKSAVENSSKFVPFVIGQIIVYFDTLA